MVQRRQTPRRKAIIITGASSGIGAAFGQSLVAPGRMLAQLGRDAGRLEAVAAACRGKGAICKTASIEVRDHAAMAVFIAAFEREHGVDVLVSNAGVLLARPSGDAVESEAEARRLLRSTSWRRPTPCISSCRACSSGAKASRPAARRSLRPTMPSRNFSGLDRNRAMIGFPVGLFWLSRIAVPCWHPTPCGVW